MLGVPGDRIPVLVNFFRRIKKCGRLLCDPLRFVFLSQSKPPVLHAGLKNSGIFFLGQIRSTRINAVQYQRADTLRRQQGDGGCNPGPERSAPHVRTGPSHSVHHGQTVPRQTVQVVFNIVRRFVRSSRPPQVIGRAMEPIAEMGHIEL